MLGKVVTPNRDSKTMQKGKGRFFNRPTISKGKKYDKFFIYVPTEVARDTNFPLKDGDRIEVEIKGKAVIITKAKD
jgi:hypothetical protein